MPFATIKYDMYAFVTSLWMYMAHSGAIVYMYLIQQLNLQQTFDDVKTCYRITCVIGRHFT